MSSTTSAPIQPPAEGLRSRLADQLLFRESAYIGGRWTDASQAAPHSVFDPSTGALVGTVPFLAEAQILQAIAAAERAFVEWRRVPAKERSRIVRRWGELMLENERDLAEILTAEQGKPLAEAVGEIRYAASFVEWFAEECKRLDGEILTAPAADKRSFVLREPIGVVAAITPWNFPSAMITRKVVPAIAAGCTAVLKPAEQTPFSALALAELAERAGLPAGVFNVTTGEPALVGGILCAHPSVRMLTFTGSTAVGRKLMAQCAPTLKKLSLELGGNAPFIVFEDADLDEAVEGAMASKFRNAGQTCVCANRFLVQESVYEAFMEKLSAAAGQLITADGRTEGAQQGPLVNDAAAERLDDLMRDALGKGATIRCGGNRVSATSRFFQPTVLGATQQMRVANEEIFGPIAPVLSFATEAEAIQLSNDTTAGLAAYVYTNDLRRAWRMLEALEFGIVGINTGVVSTESVPFGGMKQSGLGREGGRHGIEEFTELKYACLGGMGFGR